MHLLWDADLRRTQEKAESNTCATLSLLGPQLHPGSAFLLKPQQQRTQPLLRARRVQLQPQHHRKHSQPADASLGDIVTWLAECQTSSP